MTDSQPDTGARPEGVHALDPQELDAYFVLMEAVSLLQHQVEQQLRAEGGISYVQFQLLARLAGAHGPNDDRATLVTITRTGLALFGRVLPGHVQGVRRLLFDPLSGSDVGHLGGIMTRVRDHMRTQPPRSAAPRKRHSDPTTP